MEIINTTVKHPIQGPPASAHADTHDQNMRTLTHTPPSYLIPSKHLHMSCHSCLVNRHQFHLSHLNNAGCSLQHEVEG